MKRFNYDENEDFDDEYKPSEDYLDYGYDDDENEDYDDSLVVGENYININGNNKEININNKSVDSTILKKEANNKLLFKVISTLEKTWFWRFYSESYKMSKIKKMYNDLRDLLKESDDEPKVEIKLDENKESE